MKSYIFIIIASSLMLTACGSSSSNNQSQETRMATNTTEAVNNEPQRMQTSEVKESFTYKGKQYQSHIVRRADESLPMVTNDEQQQFYDNSIALKLSCEGKQLVSRTFTKKDFLHLVDANFAKQAILEGIVFNIHYAGEMSDYSTLPDPEAFPQPELFQYSVITDKSIERFNLVSHRMYSNKRAIKQHIALSVVIASNL